MKNKLNILKNFCKVKKLNEKCHVVKNGQNDIYLKTQS